MRNFLCVLLVCVGVAPALELEAELAYVNGGDLLAEESHMVVVLLGLNHTINQYLELKGRYAFGSLGIAARTGFDIKPLGLHYSLSANVDSWVYLRSTDDGVEETKPGVWFGDYLELRMGHERYNLYVEYPLGSVVILNTTPGRAYMWFGRVLEAEAGIQIARLRFGARTLTYWDTYHEVTARGDRTRLTFYGYVYGFVDFQFSKGILERAGIGFWPSTRRFRGLCLSAGVELKLDRKREAEPATE